MVADVLNVLTCSNVTCPFAPLWYDMVANWAAHGFLGVLIVAALPARLVYGLFAVLIVKETAGDLARAPSLIVAADSGMDLAAMALGAWIVARTSEIRRNAVSKTLARLWPQQKR